MFNPRYLLVIGLNPSTADETTDDPTIRRCISFAKLWGYGALCMTNLYAYRSTSPEALLTVPEPVGFENDLWIAHMARNASLILAAWGTHKAVGNRASAVCAFLETSPLVCLGRTKEGAPRHPLYVRQSQAVEPYL